MAIYENKYVVFNRKDLADLTKKQQKALDDICNAVNKQRLIRRKSPNPSYFVCNQDEPYATKVIEIILSGEDRKRGERCRQ